MPDLRDLNRLLIGSRPGHSSRLKILRVWKLVEHHTLAPTKDICCPYGRYALAREEHPGEKEDLDNLPKCERMARRGPREEPKYG